MDGGMDRQILLYYIAFPVNQMKRRLKMLSIANWKIPHTNPIYEFNCNLNPDPKHYPNITPKLNTTTFCQGNHCYRGINLKL